MMSMSYHAAMREPLLEVDHEKAAIRSWQDQGDPKALEVLVRSHARQAWSHAARFTDNPVHLEDLAAEGVIGIIRAANNFDREQEVRFSTYAAWWIMNGVSNALSRIKAVIDIPARTYLDAQLGRLPEEERRLVRMAAQGLVAIDSAAQDDDPTGRNMLVSGDIGPEEALVLDSHQQALARLLQDALAEMTAEEVAVIHRRKLRSPPDPLAEIATDLGTSTDRLRQVEKRAILRLRRKLIDKGFSRNVLT
ncbi:sigma-70 family RNA polymerase sigma factor [Pseudooceanicola aestuarii]|uniref:sigma-70 family RNA polymerase sigma factor n=1 Tax=Pseudooceanicola aestuarii TaxID=2697319 RepID=UPI0013D635AC|nr:sigma-70 family RNA polymerase sigma factor [Pseudooceanicola aestuarii]